MLHSRPTLVFKLLIRRRPIVYVLPLPPHHRPLFLAVLLRLLPSLLGFSNGMLEVFEPEALNYFTFFRPILLTSSASRNPILTHLLDSLRSDRTHSRSGILSPNATHTSGSVIIFVRQGLSFSELSTSSLSSLDPYFDYVEVKISLNNSSLSFLNVYAAPIGSSPTNVKTDSFSLSIFPCSRNLFILGDFKIAITLPRTQEVLRTPVGRKCSTGSSPLTSSHSMTLTHPPFYLAPPLAYSLLLPLLLFLAPGRCFSTWVLTIYRFFYPSLSSVFRPNERAPSFNFQKAR